MHVQGDDHIYIDGHRCISSSVKPSLLPSTALYKCYHNGDNWSSCRFAIFNIDHSSHNNFCSILPMPNYNLANQRPVMINV